MNDDPLEDIPVRDVNELGQMDPKQKRIVEKWSREDIEDNYLQIYTENNLPKKHVRHQEEKIKKLNTKIQKMFNDNKNLLKSGGAAVGMTKRDVELNEKIEDQNMKISELQKENNMLKDKLAVAKQQLEAQNKRPANSTQVDNEALKVLEGEREVEPGSNYLYVKIEKCSDLNSRLPDRQPSPYVVYKFFDFDDYDTPVVENSCHPQFSDNKSFKVNMSDSLDNYLKASELELYVFDDSQQSSDLAFLGIAKVPLTELAHNRAIHGPYEIRLPDGKTNGSISVNLKWFSDYKSRESSDSEMFVNTKTMKSFLASSVEDPNLISIVVHSVALESNCKALKDPDLVSLFVIYKFLDIPLEYTETPSLEIPLVAEKNLEFNFQKLFFVSALNNGKSREALKEMLLAGPNDNAGKIK